MILDSAILIWLPLVLAIGAAFARQQRATFALLGLTLLGAFVLIELSSSR